MLSLVYIICIWDDIGASTPKKSIRARGKASYESQRLEGLQYSIEQYLNSQKLETDAQGEWYKAEFYFDEKGYLKDKFYTQEEAVKGETIAKIYRLVKQSDPLIYTADPDDINKQPPEGCDYHCYIADQYILPIYSQSSLKIQMDNEWLYFFPDDFKIVVLNQEKGFRIIELNTTYIPSYRYRIVDNAIEIKGEDYQQKYAWLHFNADQAVFKWRTSSNVISANECKQVFKTINQACDKILSCSLKEIHDPYSWYNTEADTASKETVESFEALNKIEKTTHLPGINSAALINVCHQVCSNQKVRFNDFKQEACAI